MITLKTLPQASEQDVFNQIYYHLITQKEKSLTEDGLRCMYRSSTGLKCAVGCLIADDEYKPEMERKSWRKLMELGYAPSVNKNLTDIITDLQTMHDFVHVSEWRIELDSIRIKYKLKKPE